METPNPTKEEFLNAIEEDANRFRNATPENCPYFSVSVAASDAKDGVRIAYADPILNPDAASYPKYQNTNEPDRIATFPLSTPDGNIELFRATNARSRLFVTDDGLLCFAVHKIETTVHGTSGHGMTIVHKELPEQDVWLVYPEPNPLYLKINESPFFPFDRICAAIKARNIEQGALPPAILREVIRAKWRQLDTPTATLASFPIHTGQEWQALQHLAGDGKYFDGQLFKLNEQGGSLRYKRPSDSFYTEVTLTDEERAAGHGVDLLRDATRLLDIDSALIWFYVSELLSPIGTLPANAAAFAWIDLDDVANKTLGGYASNPEEKQQRRAQVYHSIKYGARTFVGGARSIPYFDKQTGAEIPTKIYVTPWQISGLQESETPSLWPELDVPLRVRLVASPEWTALTTHRDATQWLPLAEKIGAISGNKPGGAWARALALSYFDWCRIHPHEALAGQTPAREELLNANTPKKQPYKELLETSHAARIREYWATAESHLSDAGIIEPVRHRDQVSKSGSDEWRRVWLKAPAPWQPGPEIQAALEAIVSKKYLEKPRQLNPAKRRGRPRKNSAKP